MLRFAGGEAHTLQGIIGRPTGLCVYAVGGWTTILFAAWGVLVYDWYTSIVVQQTVSSPLGSLVHETYESRARAIANGVLWAVAGEN